MNDVNKLNVNVGRPTKGLGAVHSNRRTETAVPAGKRAGSPVAKGKDVVPVRNVRGGADSIPVAKPKAAHRPNVHPTPRR